MKLNIGINTIYQIMSRAASAIVALINTRLLTTYLGAAGYGQYQIAAVYVSLFWILTDFGLDTLVVREISSDESKTQTYFSRLFTLRLLIGAVLTTIALGTMFFLPYPTHVKVAIVIGAATILFQSIMGAAVALFQAKLQYKYFFITYLIGSLILLLGIFTTLQFTSSIIWLIGIYTLNVFGMMVTSLYFAKKWVRLQFSRVAGEVKQLFIRTIPFGLIILFDLGILKLDVLLLSVLPLESASNDVVVGVYNVSYKIYELATVVGLFFVNALYPLMNKQFSQRLHRQFAKFGGAAVLLLGIIGVVGTVLLYILAPLMISLLTDLGEFTPSIEVLRVLSIGLVPVFIATLGKFIMIIYDKQRQLVYVYLAGFLFNLVTNVWLIPRYTYFAAATTTVFTQTIVMVLLIICIMINSERVGLTKNIISSKNDEASKNE